MKIVRFDALEYVPAGHENPQDPGVWKKVLLQSGDLVTGEPKMVNWAKLPPGRTFAAHYHEDMQEFFVMIQGEARMLVAGEPLTLAPGDTILIEPGETHKMWNETSEDVLYLAMGIAAGTGGQTVMTES